MKAAIHTHTSLIPDTARARKAYAGEKALMMGKLSKMILFFYVLTLFRPFVPMASDWIAHTFYEQQHILMVHEVNGKFHMHDEVGKALQHGDHEKGNTASFDTTEYKNASSFVLLATVPTVSHRLHSDVQMHILHISIDIDSPPPCTGQVASV